MNKWKLMQKQTLQTLFPKHCVCCGKRISDDEDLCSFCYYWLERVNVEKRCLQCGLEKKQCHCKSHAFHFVKVIAPFYNAGLAQKGFYRLKFGDCECYTRFFAEEMAKCVATEYYRVPFSGICYVPISGRHLRKRGFDQSEELAKELSRILKLPLLRDALIHRIGGKTQHELGEEARFSAIRGKYKTGLKLSGKILLVDDIKTTGATLDECARELLFAGADEVYCVTALISSKDYEIKSPYTLKVCGFPRKAVARNEKV